MDKQAEPNGKPTGAIGLKEGGRESGETGPNLWRKLNVALSYRFA